MQEVMRRKLRKLPRDYIPEEDGGAANNLPEPPALATMQTDLPSNVVKLFG